MVPVNKKKKIQTNELYWPLKYSPSFTKIGKNPSVKLEFVVRQQGVVKDRDYFKRQCS
jgi:hypothetical protein